MENVFEETEIENAVEAIALSDLLSDLNDELIVYLRNHENLGPLTEHPLLKKPMRNQRKSIRSKLRVLEEFKEECLVRLPEDHKVQVGERITAIEEYFFKPNAIKNVKLLNSAVVGLQITLEILKTHLELNDFQVYIK